MSALIPLGFAVTQNFDLLGVARADLRTAAPLQPSARTDALAGEPFKIDARGSELADILALDADGEVLSPVLAEIEIDPPGPLTDSGNVAFDELLGVHQPAEIVRVGRIAHPIGGHGPEPAFGFARHSLAESSPTHARLSGKE